MEFEFERRRVTKEDVRELIYREILEYHPQMLKEFLGETDCTNFMYPSAVDQFKKQFAYLEEHYGKGGTIVPLERQHASLPRPSVLYSNSAAAVPEKSYLGSSRDLYLEVCDQASRCIIETEKLNQDRISGNMIKVPVQVPEKILQGGAAKPGKVIGSVLPYENCGTTDVYDPRRLARNSVLTTQYAAPGHSYPRRSSTAKNELDEKEDGATGSHLMQPKAQHIGIGGRSLAAAQSGTLFWY